MGSGRRFDTLQFPNIPNKIFKKFIDDKLFKEIKLIYPMFKKASQLKVFVNRIGSDLAAFAKYY